MAGEAKAQKMQQLFLAGWASGDNQSESVYLVRWNKRAGQRRPSSPTVQNNRSESCTGAPATTVLPISKIAQILRALCIAGNSHDPGRRVAISFVPLSLTHSGDDCPGSRAEMLSLRFSRLRVSRGVYTSHLERGTNETRKREPRVHSVLA